MILKYVPILLAVLLLSGCQQSQKDAQQKLTEVVVRDTTSDGSSDASSQHTAPQTADAEAWLKSIFKTKNSDKHFPDYNVEEKLCTKRFFAFIVESGELYGPSNLTDEEYPAVERAYKAKWSPIYPIEEREMWLFGRGNGDIGELKQLEIRKLKDKLYRVFIDYGNGIKTESEVTVVTEDGDYKIDYCKTVFLN